VTLHFALGSLWTPLPGMLVVIVLATGTDLEDATLQRELAGYAEFAVCVRYKWIPGKVARPHIDGIQRRNVDLQRARSST
jgi:hypothetical protein